MIERIAIAEDGIRANLRRTACKQCGREYFMTIAKDGSVVQPCPVCLGLFEDERRERAGFKARKMEKYDLNTFT